MKKIFVNLAMLAFVLSPFGLAAPVQAATSWDVSGSHVWTVLGTYTHDLTLTQNDDGTFVGTGGYPAGGPYQTTETISGSVSGDMITITTTYNGPYNPGYTVTATGAIASDGSISGTSPWPWTMSGVAHEVIPSNTVVVRPSNLQGWSTSDTRTGGTVGYVTDPGSPLPTGALQLITDATNAAKAQYIHAANIPLSEITNLSYRTKQISASFPGGDPSYQLIVDLNGGTLTDGGFTTLVYEPYQNGTVSVGNWQTWDVDAGQMWSSRSFTNGGCSVTAGAGGAPFYTLTGLQSSCPNAVVIGFGVNIGSYNPSYTVETDGVRINNTIYNFEQDIVPEENNIDQCKNNGWNVFTSPTFKNQGQCVSYVQANDHAGKK